MAGRAWRLPKRGPQAGRLAVAEAIWKKYVEKLIPTA